MRFVGGKHHTLKLLTLGLAGMEVAEQPEEERASRKEREAAAGDVCPAAGEASMEQSF